MIWWCGGGVRTIKALNLITINDLCTAQERDAGVGLGRDGRDAPPPVHRGPRRALHQRALPRPPEKVQLDVWVGWVCGIHAADSAENPSFYTNTYAQADEQAGGRLGLCPDAASRGAATGVRGV